MAIVRAVEHGAGRGEQSGPNPPYTKAAPHLPRHRRVRALSSKAEVVHDLPVALDLVFLKVVEKGPAFSDEVE